MKIDFIQTVSILLYRLFLKLYYWGICLSAKQNNKAQQWLEGRKDIFKNLKTALNINEQRIWIHCASLGEFEQGRPVIETIKRQYPEYKILLTFFSPSGYEIRKNYAQADYVFYLPLDSKKNALEFINIVNPKLAVFVKYEFWHFYLKTLQNQEIPVFLISANFRKNQPFFKWYGSFFRKMLSRYRYIFVQNLFSQKLLAKIEIQENVIVAGDTRYDRVLTIAREAKDLPLISSWKNKQPIVVAGSTWLPDEKLLNAAFKKFPEDWKLVIAPHDISQNHLKEIETLFDNNTIRYSQLATAQQEKKILLMDNIGMLSTLYRYGEIAYVGGGFTTGIHNILEPAVYGLPVIFGKDYQRFDEANEMLALAIAFTIQDAKDLKSVLINLITDEKYRSTLQAEILTFIKSKKGATDCIMKEISRIL